MNRLSSTRLRLAPSPPILISSTALVMPSPRPCSSWCLAAQLACSPQDGLDDVLVAGAAAEVAGQRPAHLVLRRVGVLIQQGLRRHHHPRGTESALQPVLVLEALL